MHPLMRGLVSEWKVAMNEFSEYRICSTCHKSKPISMFGYRWYGKKQRKKFAGGYVMYEHRKQCKTCYNQRKNMTRRIKRNPYAAMIASISVSKDFDRTKLFELGRRAPYFRFMNFPVHTDSPNKNGDCF